MQWTVKQASEFLKVSEDTIHEWVEQRSLPATLFNDRYHFNRVKVIDWALENRVPIFSRDEKHYPSLQKVIRSGGIHRGIPGEDLSSVLKAVVGRLPLPEGSNRELIWQMLMAREKEGATALGNGIAVPHARHPIILGVEGTLLGLCFLEHELDLDAPDGKKVFALFVMVTPNIQSHLHYLGRLGHVLRDKELLQALQERGIDEEIQGKLEKAEDAVPSEPPSGV